MMNNNIGSAGFGQGTGHILCEVEDCVYNDKRKSCTASAIEVSSDGCGCDSCSDTCCRTFKKS